MPPIFRGIAAFYIATCGALVAVPLALPDESYAARRSKATRLPMESSWDASLAKWGKSKLLSSEQIATLKTAIGVYSGNHFPNIFDQFAEDAVLECPMFTFSSGHRVSRAWRAVRMCVEIRPEVKMVSKDGPEMFVEIASNIKIRVVNFSFPFLSSVYLRQNEAGKLVEMHHRWYGGRLLGSVSFPNAWYAPLFDAIRLGTGTMICLVPV